MPSWPPGRTSRGDPVGQIRCGQRCGRVAHEPLVRVDGLRPAGEIIVDPPGDAGVEGIGRDDVMHEAQRARFLGVEGAAGREQLPSVARADRAHTYGAIVAGSRPSRTSANANRAPSTAIATSLHATSPAPPPIADR